MLSTSAAWLAFLVFAGTMTYAGVKDVATMTISNRLVGFLLIAFAVLAPLAGLDLSTIWSSILVASAVLACTFAFFALGWIGGGDAKLLPVAVLWLGPGLALSFVIYASVLGAVLTLTLLQFRRVPLPLVLKKRAWSSRLHQPQSGIPYGAAMAPAALLLLPESHWFSALL
ncbi:MULTISPECIES: prepilin peptidase [Sinorhizobium]|uniref:A24 family peptidase n=1 Tax=Sinorhizobium TaxID=28105 RepID=UPI000BEA926D|nr:MULTISPECIES: prepilin peptidase [Sinorhizobium]PDT49044.1 pilus assembly protein CpaA [Sinorhizobium sp. NG07B]POH33165.1 pilus assembly protein CpaA [Sinorhizobium americanum]